MSIIHKKNSGYIGVDYREPYPSGIRVSGGVGRVREVTVDVELYGGKGRDYFRTPFLGVGYGANGGYTKFRVNLSSTFTFQIRPSYVQGGSYSFPGVDSSGGAGAGLLINDQWLGVAGGGGGGGGKLVYQFSDSSFFGEAANNGSSGQGGYGGGSPSTGTNGLTCSVYEPSSGSPTYWGQSISGSGGGGAAGGANGGSGCYGSFTNPGPYGGGGGGSGNLRIYYDQSATSGNLNAVPGVYMQYITHSNGSHNGSAQVKLTNVDTTQNYTYTSSKDLKAIYLATGEFNP